MNNHYSDLPDIFKSWCKNNPGKENRYQICKDIIGSKNDNKICCYSEENISLKILIYENESTVTWIPTMFKYIRKCKLTDEECINRIITCRQIIAYDTKEQQNKFDIDIVDMYLYSIFVHKDAFCLHILELCKRIPELNKLIDERYNKINIPYEKFKASPEMSPLFNGSGCTIL